VLEAYSMGVPVIGSRSGGLESVIEDGRTGLLFVAADAMDLGDKVRWASTHPDAMSAMGDKARAVYLERYTGAVNYQLLRAVYARASALGEEYHGDPARPGGAPAGQSEVK